MRSLFFIIILVINSNTYSQKNLITNGGFEMEFSNWQGDVAELSTFDKKIGNTSAIITQYTGAQWKAIDQTVNLPKNTAAVLCSGWVKAEAIERGEKEWNTGKYDIEFISANGKNIKNENIAAVIGTTNWTYYKKLINVPTAATKLRVMLALGETNGTILFDDIKVFPLSVEDCTKIREEENAKRIASEKVPNAATFFNNGNFENGITSWRGNISLSKQIFKEGATAVVLNSNTPDWVGIDQVANIPNNVSTITISGWLKADAVQQGKESWNTGLMNVEFTGDTNTKTAEDQNIAFITGTKDWTFYSKKIQLPTGTTKFRIMIALGFTTGTLYADAITVSFN